MIDKHQAKELIDKFLAGKCTPEEEAIIERFYLEESAKRRIISHSVDLDRDKKEAYQNILTAIRTPQSNRIKTLWFKRVVAASILLALGTSIYFIGDVIQGADSLVRNEFADIAPGSDKAILTLENGSKVNLHDIKEGETINQNGLSITKTDDGQLICKVVAPTQSALGHSDKVAETNYNVIETPVGGKYQIMLADGTRVWLNAQSSLRYPTTFAHNERRVELIGEAYFEVAPDKTRQFNVLSSGQTVKVLGTHFSVNSYADEAGIKTTLFEGEVLVSQHALNIHQALKPGQQALNDGSTIHVSTVDLEAALAWKNGYFVFAHEELGSVMRKIARWYNIEVIYKDSDVSKQVISGSISMSANASEFFRIIELTELVHFKIEGRRVTVMK